MQWTPRTSWKMSPVSLLVIFSKTKTFIALWHISLKNLFWINKRHVWFTSSSTSGNVQSVLFTFQTFFVVYFNVIFTFLKFSLLTYAITVIAEYSFTLTSASGLCLLSLNYSNIKILFFKKSHGINYQFCMQFTVVFLTEAFTAYFSLPPERDKERPGCQRNEFQRNCARLVLCHYLKTSLSCIFLSQFRGEQYHSGGLHEKNSSV